MVEERATDGRRIAELLSSELHGREDGGLATVAVVDAERDVEPSVDGALAYRVTHGKTSGSDAVGGERLADVYVHPDRVRVELRDGHEAAVEAAAGPHLRVRPKAVDPPRTLLFVEAGAAVKRAADAVGAAAAAGE